MATEKVILSHSAKAAVDLSAKQFFLVKLDASGNLVLGTAGSKALALQDAPASGRTGTVALVGTAKVVAGGTIAPGDYLSCDAAGKAVVATASNIVDSGSIVQGTYIVGQALHPAVAGDVTKMHIAKGLA